MTIKNLNTKLYKERKMLLDTIKILVQSAQNEQDYLHCKKLLEDKLVWLQCEQHKIFSNTKMLDILPDSPVEDAIGITLLSLITQSPEFQDSVERDVKNVASLTEMEVEVRELIIFVGQCLNKLK